uniref:Uncharacterized protein n=1 Tax=Ditylenchus dipsaci TaxID=166011 RepID=A0A915DC43_9BILA
MVHYIQICHTLHTLCFRGQKERKIESLQQLVDENTFDCIVNCAGLNGGKLAEMMTQYIQSVELLLR